ncbi:hypothetical protein XSR1_150090 [Xenorhabdus szentirmaii DSM 16338]|uniref:Uncharacterized protein n=1 Tax=Xenorhabdus szentirmaii DSM 16338 TaxID=1427518 RepID=W1IV80_9GAMM|nr:hypothetical protein XSR1_150090 [Xenorhabdus szentirmaii DSM 16338]
MIIRLQNYFIGMSFIIANQIISLKINKRIDRHFKRFSTILNFLFFNNELFLLVTNDHHFNFLFYSLR